MRILDKLDELLPSERSKRCPICSKHLAYQRSDVYVKKITSLSSLNLGPIKRSYHLTCIFCKQMFPIRSRDIPAE